MPFTTHGQFSPGRAGIGVSHRDRLQVGRNDPPEESGLPCQVIRRVEYIFKCLQKLESFVLNGIKGKVITCYA